MTVEHYCSRCGHYLGAFLDQPIYECPRCGATFDRLNMLEHIKEGRRTNIFFFAVFAGMIGFAVGLVISGFFGYKDDLNGWYGLAFAVPSAVGVGIVKYRSYKKTDGII